MATPFRLVPRVAAPPPRPRPASAHSVERANVHYVESALAALAGTVRASRIRVLTDLADLERRALDGFAAAERVRGAVEAGGLESPGSRESAERDLAGVGTLLRGRQAGAHLSIAASAADTVEAAFEVALAAASRGLSADL